MQCNISNSRGGRPPNDIRDFSSSTGCSLKSLPASCCLSFPHPSTATHYGKATAKSSNEYLPQSLCGNDAENVEFLRQHNPAPKIHEQRCSVKGHSHETILEVSRNKEEAIGNWPCREAGVCGSAEKQHFLGDSHNSANRSNRSRMHDVAAAEMSKENLTTTVPANPVAVSNDVAVVLDRGTDDWCRTARPHSYSRSNSLQRVATPLRNLYITQPPPPDALVTNCSPANTPPAAHPLPPPEPPTAKAPCKHVAGVHTQSKDQATDQSSSKQFSFDAFNGSGRKKFSLSQNMSNAALPPRPNQSEAFLSNSLRADTTASINSKVPMPSAPINANEGFERITVSRTPPTFQKKLNNAENKDFSNAIKSLLTSLQPPTASPGTYCLKQEGTCSHQPSGKNCAEKQHSSAITSKEMPAKVNNTDGPGECKDNGVSAMREITNYRSHPHGPSVAPSNQISNETISGFPKASRKNYCWETMGELTVTSSLHSVSNTSNQNESERNKGNKCEGQKEIPILSSLATCSSNSLLQASDSLLREYAAENIFSCEAGTDILQRCRSSTDGNIGMSGSNSLAPAEYKRQEKGDSKASVKQNNKPALHNNGCKDETGCNPPPPAAAEQQPAEDCVTNIINSGGDSREKESPSKTLVDTCRDIPKNGCDCTVDSNKEVTNNVECCVLLPPVLRQPAVSLCASGHIPTFPHITSLMISPTSSDCRVPCADGVNEIASSVLGWVRQPAVHSIGRLCNGNYGNTGDIDVALGTCCSPNNGFSLWRHSKDEYTSNRSSRQGLTDFLLWGALERNSDWSFACHNKFVPFASCAPIGENIVYTKLEDGPALMASMRNAKICEFEKRLLLSKLSMNEHKVANGITKVDTPKVEERPTNELMEALVSKQDCPKVPSQVRSASVTSQPPALVDPTVLPRADEILSSSGANNKELTTKIKEGASNGGYREQGRGKKRNTGSLSKGQPAPAPRSAKAAGAGGSNSAKQASAVSRPSKAAAPKSIASAKSNSSEKADPVLGGDDHQGENDDKQEQKQPRKVTPNPSEVEGDLSPAHYCSFVSLPSSRTDDETSKGDGQKENKSDTSMYCTPEEPGTPETTRRESCSTCNDPAASPPAHLSRSGSVSIMKQPATPVPNVNIAPREIAHEIFPKKKSGQKNRRESFEVTKKESPRPPTTEAAPRDSEFPPLTKLLFPTISPPQSKVCSLPQHKKQAAKHEGNASWASKLCSPTKSKGPSPSFRTTDKAIPAAPPSKKSATDLHHASGNPFLSKATTSWSSSSSFSSSCSYASSPSASPVHGFQTMGVTTSSPCPSGSTPPSSSGTPYSSSYTPSSSRRNTASFFSSSGSLSISSSSSFISFRDSRPAAAASSSSSSASSLRDASSVVSSHMSMSTLSRSTACASSHSASYLSRNSPAPLTSNTSSPVSSPEAASYKMSPLEKAESQASAPLSASAILLLQHLNPTRSPEDQDSRIASAKLPARASHRQDTASHDDPLAKARQMNTSSTAKQASTTPSPSAKSQQNNTGVPSGRRGSFPGAANTRPSRKQHQGPASFPPPPAPPDDGYDFSILHRLSRPALIAAANQTLLNRARAFAENATLPPMAEGTPMGTPERSFVSNQEQSGHFPGGSNMANFLFRQHNPVHLMSNQGEQNTIPGRLLRTDNQGASALGYYNTNPFMSFEPTNESQVFLQAGHSGDFTNQATQIGPHGPCMNLYNPHRGIYSGSPVTYDTCIGLPVSSSPPFIPSHAPYVQGISSFPTSQFVERGHQMDNSGRNNSLPFACIPVGPSHTPTSSSIASCEQHGAASVASSAATSPVAAQRMQGQASFEIAGGMQGGYATFSHNAAFEMQNVSALFDEKLIPLDDIYAYYNQPFEWLRYLQASTGNIVYVNALSRIMQQHAPPSYCPAENADRQAGWHKFLTHGYDYDPQGVCGAVDTPSSYFSEQFYCGNAPVWEEPQGVGESGSPRKWVRCITMLGDVLYKDCSQPAFQVPLAGTYLQYRADMPVDFEELQPTSHKRPSAPQNVGGPSVKAGRGASTSSNIVPQAGAAGNKGVGAYKEQASGRRPSKQLGSEASDTQTSPSRRQRTVSRWQVKDKSGSSDVAGAASGRTDERQQISAAAVPNSPASGVRNASEISAGKAVDYLCKTRMLEALGVLDAETCFLVNQWVCRSELEELSSPTAVKALEFMQDVRDVWLEKWLRTSGNTFHGDQTTQNELRALISRRLRQMLYEMCKYSQQGASVG